jgi:two-component system, chemotaxis family, sensor kinase CheA
MENFDTSGLINEFLEDSRSHLDKLDVSLMEMEKDLGQGALDVEMISDLLGSLHTLKGNSGMMGFESVQQYVHQLEGVFKKLLEDGSLNNEKLQRLFNAAAVLRETLEGLKENPGKEIDLSGQIGALRDPAANETGGSYAPRKKSKSDGFKYIAEKSNILKVDFERLDHLLNLVGELVIHRTRLATTSKLFIGQHPDKSMAYELSEVTTEIFKTTSQLQEAIMKVRMLPIRQVFQRFPRMVRDLSREQGKEINLVFLGAGTELDKTVIDEIGEPLIHLIRNAVDHGIERPQERLEKKKSTIGEITLSAAQEGNQIIIRVTDDGGGIDSEAVRAKASKVYPADFIDGLSDEGVIELIFEPGFSTAHKVTEVSGRGVGLDVVKKGVTKLGGSIEVKNRPGYGTVFTIKLPLTLAIISALMVRSGKTLYALPLSSVVESVKLSPDDIQTISGDEVIFLRDRVLPLVRLSRLIDKASDPDSAGTGDRAYAVVVGKDDRMAALMVDGLMGRQEVVIKALDEYVGDGENIAGATILGDGSVVLILDIAGIVEKAAHKQAVRLY